MKCPGEAHQNAYIDHCPICAPHWGWVQSPKPSGAGLCKVRKHPHERGEWVSVYQSDEAGIDGDKYATVCEPHGNMICSKSLRAAVAAMSTVRDWCDDCKSAAAR